MGENYSSGTTPLATDPARVIEVKILRSLTSSSLGGGLSGVGSPEGVVSANAGQTYFDTVAQTFWAKGTGTGNTGWVELIA